MVDLIFIVEKLGKIYMLEFKIEIQKKVCYRIIVFKRLLYVILQCVRAKNHLML